MPQFTCPSCQRSLKVGPEAAGKTVRCPCGKQLRVPARPQPPAKKPQPPAKQPQASAKQPQPSAKQPQAAASPDVVLCSCGKQLLVPPEAAGKSIRCPCGRVVSTKTAARPSAKRVHHAPPEEDLFASLETTPAAPPSRPTGRRGGQRSAQRGGQRRGRMENPYTQPSRPAAPQYAPNPYTENAYPAHQPYPGPGPGPVANPFAAPAPTPAMSPHLGGVGVDLVGIRYTHLQQETSIAVLAVSYMVSGVLTCLYMVFAIVMILSVDPAAQQPGEADLSTAIVAFMALVVFAIAGLHVAVGVGLWRLQSWAKGFATLSSVLGLPGFPVGTAFSIYFLYLLNNRAGNFIFSPEYRRVVAQTPHIRPEVWMIVKILLGWLLLFVLSAAPFIALIVMFA